jgi:predicted transcriptional regulator
MPTQKSLLAEDASTPDTDLIDLGKGLGIRITRGYKAQAKLYRHGALIKTVYLLDKVAKRIFVVEVVELGAIQSRLADALGITRQTIHNYREIQKHFGVEGLIHGYTVKDTKSKERQKKLHADKRPQGNKAQQVAQIRRQERLEQSSVPETEAINFSVANELLSPLSPEEQPFAQEKDWEPTRYAGVGIYWIALLTHWKWLQLITNHFGNGWRIFAVFLLMASQNIRSIEQLKNVHSREAGRILGLEKYPVNPSFGRGSMRLRRDKRHRDSSLRISAINFRLAWWVCGCGFLMGICCRIPARAKSTTHSIHNDACLCQAAPIKSLPMPLGASWILKSRKARVI